MEELYHEVEGQNKDDDDKESISDALARESIPLKESPLCSDWRYHVDVKKREGKRANKWIERGIWNAMRE